MTSRPPSSPRTNASGRVRVAYTRDATLPLAAVRAEVLARRGARLVVVAIREVPPLDALLDEIVRAMADAALALWPDWYEGRLRPGEGPPTLERALDDRRLFEEVVALVPGISPQWLKPALASVRAGRPPLVADATRTTQVEQAVLVSAPAGLSFALIVEAAGASEDRLLGLARAVEWTANVARADVTVVLPPELCDDSALATIAYARLSLPEEFEEAEESVGKTNRDVALSRTASEDAAPAALPATTHAGTLPAFDLSRARRETDRAPRRGAFDKRRCGIRTSRAPSSV